MDAKVVTGLLFTAIGAALILFRESIARNPAFAARGTKPLNLAIVGGFTAVIGLGFTLNLV